MFLLDSFGHAKTLSNSNASRFGRYTELQFNEHGRLTGIKSLEYLLEKSRVSACEAGQRNFHVLYYLLAGVSPDERAYLKLDGFGTFRYLSNWRGQGSSHEGHRYTQLKAAFKAVGFPKKAVASICQLLAAVLHLGNVDFVVDKRRNEDSAVVKNYPTLEIVAEFLGVDAGELELALTQKSSLVGNTVCQIFLDAEGAAANRDELANALYGLIFSWIGEFINEKLCRDDFDTFIALVDFPGPVQAAASRGDGGNLDAFCFNLMAERVHAFATEQLFEKNKAEYEAEGIELPGLKTTYHSNSECSRLLTHVPGGLVHIIDDQSRRRGKTDTTMLRAMAKRWGNHSSFASREGDEALGRPGTFTCSHWDGQVTYSTENFLADNSAVLSPNYITLLGGSTPKVGVDGRTTPNARDALSTGGSSFSFVRQLFAGEGLQRQAHPSSNEVIVGANQKVAPKRAPSTRRPKGRNPNATTFGDSLAPGGDDEPASSKNTDGRSVVQDLNESLSLLYSTLASSTKAWHVLCIRPNDGQLPNQVDSKLLKHQVRALGLPELSQRLKGEFTVNVELKEWWERYQSVPALAAEHSTVANLAYKDKVVKSRELLGFSEREMRVGKTKVFMTDGAFRYLDDFLRAEHAPEQQRVADREARGLLPAGADPYSPYAVPESALYDHPKAGQYSEANSISALPFVNTGAAPGIRGTYDVEDGDELDFDGKEVLAEFANGGGHDYLAAPAFSGYGGDDRSIAPSSLSRPMFAAGNLPEKDFRDDEEKEETVEEVKKTWARSRWVGLTWAFTWWIPSFMLTYCGGMKRPDVRMAWREKVLINMLIWLLCGIAVFVIAILGNLICPTEHVYSTAELASHSYSADIDNMYVAIRGEVFDLTSFAPYHLPGSDVIKLKTIQAYGGTDASNIFPVQVSALCTAQDGSTLSPWITLDASNTTATTAAQYHDFRAFQTDSRPDWYAETMIYLRYNFRKGFIGYKPKAVRSTAEAGSAIAIYKDAVYDFSTYVTNGGGGTQTPAGQSAPSDTERAFMPSDVVNLFQTKAGSDVTKYIKGLGMTDSELGNVETCMRNLFYAGKVDHSNSVQCQFADVILIVFSAIMMAIIGFKFIAALRFGRKRKPEDYDKFVICQVPCYTEGEESLRNCIDSLTKLKYDDKRKLLVVICDGMIVGSGNDKPTPTIVLDLLGADPSIDPEPLSFHSIGEGAKQHNMAKVYSGLHEAAGHIVPYLVVVKVGKPTERSRPGNRGKRDSQMILMRFLNRVHFDSPMSPCELEMYHQIKNVIGVNPSFYEYILMVDADTVVDPFSLNYLIGNFVEDQKIIGLCGETSLSNAKASWTTMMQVYEYYISHHLAKAFESLFGCVTCLPGCFSVYRIRTLDHKPLIIANPIIEQYGESKVETLHVKNLLSLGEDRYLSTIMLKAFPRYRTKFCPEARAMTIAPDDWKVLMSQRRRWINSTIHNLAELIFVDGLCGFCCFSMRFVVLVDLISTLVAPVTVAYIVYLIYEVAGLHKQLPTLALAMLGVIYGLQALIFIFDRKFEHIGWMLVYICAIPLYSFVLPLVSFWQMDDFSWGSTREIVGEKGKRLIVHDEGKFDPSSIPLKSWQEFENELWEQGSNQSIGELLAEGQRDGDSRYGAESMYGLEKEVPVPYGALSARGSPSLSQHNFMQFDNQSAYGAGGGIAGGSQYGGSMHNLSQMGMMMPAQARGSMMSMGQGSMAGAGRRDSYFSQGTGMGGGGMGMHGSGSQLGLNQLAGGGAVPFGQLPGDQQIVADTQRILAQANLQTLTKKGVRQELEALYGCELGDRRQLVNGCIEETLGLA